MLKLTLGRINALVSGLLARAAGGAVARILAASMLMLFAGFAVAQQGYPSKPIRLIVPWAAGGGTDPIARMLAAFIGPRLGQQIIVDFKPGAAGVIGTSIAMHAPPDGYTLLLTSPAPLVNAKFLVPDLNYKPEEVTTIVQLTDAPISVFGNANFLAKDLKQLIEYARKNPGKVNMGVPGLGGQGHLAAALIEYRAKVKFTIIPYKGTGDILSDLRTGRVDAATGFPAAYVPGKKAGYLRGLAVLGETRVPDLPDVPTAVELGFPDIKQGAWFMLFGPKGLPRSIVNRLNAETNAFLASENGKTALQKLGYEVTQGSTPEGSAKVLEADVQTFKEIHEAGAMKMN